MAVTMVIGNSSRTLTFAAFAGGNNGLFALGYDANLYAIDPGNAKATKIGATGLCGASIGILNAVYAVE